MATDDEAISNECIDDLVINVIELMRNIKNDQIVHLYVII